MIKSPEIPKALPRDLTLEAFNLLVQGMKDAKNRRFTKYRPFSERVHKLYMGFIKELHRSGY